MLGDEKDRGDCEDNDLSLVGDPDFMNGVRPVGLTRPDSDINWRPQALSFTEAPKVQVSFSIISEILLGLTAETLRSPTGKPVSSSSGQLLFYAYLCSLFYDAYLCASPIYLA